MRRLLVICVVFGSLSVSLPTTTIHAQTSAKDTPAAERTRTKLLKVKVTASFENAPLRECLKELAAQVDMMAERPVMWTYSMGLAPDIPVNYSCKDKPLDEVLDELFKRHGLGYVVLSKEDDRHDGWVQVTRGTERGYGTNPTVTSDGDEDEKKASGRLKLAKELIEKGRAADAKAVLTLVTTKYPKTKAATEAKELLEKIRK